MGATAPLPSTTADEEPADRGGRGGGLRRRGGVFLGIPVIGWMLIFFAVPYFLLFLQSFWEAGPFGTVHN